MKWQKKVARGGALKQRLPLATFLHPLRGESITASATDSATLFGK